MNWIIGIIIGIIVGIVATLLVSKKKIDEAGMREDDIKKLENLKKIEGFIANKERFTNDDLEDLLKVSDTTIGRYLDELEACGKIIQHGDTGSGVYYTKK
ncbi:MAG: DUF977 family protein [Patescibacteria group bacterium]